MSSFTTEQLQSVLDSYSRGKIEKNDELPQITLRQEDYEVLLTQNRVKTSHGTYLIVGSPGDDIHMVWWNSTPASFEDLLKKTLMIKEAKFLLTNEDVVTVHRHNARFSVFELES